MLKQVRDAEAWLGGLQVDPVMLSARNGMKGKKHFVEWLLGNRCAIEHYRSSPGCDSEADRVRQRVLNALAVLDTTAFHDLGGADNKRFAEDVLSYLYTCRLAQEFGYDTSNHLAEIKKILPRIYAHAPTRGASARMALVRRLGALGLPATDTMERLVAGTQLRLRKPVGELLKVHVYLIVHEVFHLTDSVRQPPHLLSHDDRSYLSGLLGGLLHPVMIDDIDLLAEVVEALLCLGMVEMGGVRAALNVIASNQNADGSFGKYEEARATLRQQGSLYDVDVGMYLHTTSVCLNALVKGSTNLVGVGV